MNFKNWQTDIFAYAKIALGLVFVYLKLSKGQSLNTEDMVILGALGLGAGGSKVSADATKVPPA